MEFVEGRNLRELLESGSLPPARAARLLRHLAAALDASHAHGIWHRDVKPENVTVRRDGSPEEDAVLIDFSIAIVKDANETLHGLSRAAVSFDYMAPEQVGLVIFGDAIDWGFGNTSDGSARKRLPSK
jgi:serine/threonine-protein kinase